jgi:hypothetical protein
MPSELAVAELPLGPDGLNGSNNPSVLKPTELTRALNIAYQGGSLRKEGGASKYTPSALSGAPSIIGGMDWRYDGITQRSIIITSAGTILKDAGTGAYATTLKSGLTVTDISPRFCEAGKEAAANNRKLFIFTGKNAVQVLSADGATTTDLTTPPADWTAGKPTFGTPHDSRIWAGGNTNDPHRIYYTTLTNHEDFTGAGSGSISVFPGEGERLVGAISFKGLLIAFKYPVGIYVIDTTSPTIGNWRVNKASGTVGLANENAFAEISDDVIAILTPNADLRILQASDFFGNFSAPSITDGRYINEFMRRELQYQYSAKWRLCWYHPKRELHLACTSKDSTTNDARLVVDVTITGNPRWRYSTRDKCISFWTRIGSNTLSQMVSGDNAGNVWLMDTDTRSKDGAGYNGEFKTAETDLSHIEPRLATQRKNGKFIELTMEPVGNWDILVEVHWDGKYSQTVSFNMGTNGAVLGSFILGTDRLGGGQLLQKKRRITGSGRRISIVGKNNQPAQDFALSRMLLHYKTGSDKV